MSGSTPATSPTLNNNGNTIRLSKTSWQESEASLRLVREKVFIQEQRVPEEMEWDEYDAMAVHYLAANAEGQPIGCIRLLNSGQISRLCVLEALRGQGIGRLLLETVQNEARQQGMTEVFLHAQTQASHFYEAAGFIVNGGIFVEAGIPHRQMIKELID